MKLGFKFKQERIQGWGFLEINMQKHNLTTQANDERTQKTRGYSKKNRNKTCREQWMKIMQPYKLWL